MDTKTDTSLPEFQNWFIRRMQQIIPNVDSVYFLL